MTTIKSASITLCLFLGNLFIAGTAIATCGTVVISGSTSPTVASYDPLINTTQSQAFSLTVQNIGVGNCRLSLIPFSTTGSTTVNLSDGTSNLSYGVSNDNAGTFSDVTTDIPGVVPSSVKQVQIDGNSSSSQTWYLNAAGGVMTDAGSYTDSSIQIRAYEHDDEDLLNFDSGNLSLVETQTVTAGASVSQTCDFPTVPTVTLTNLTSAYGGGLSGTIDLSSAINANSATLNTTALELSYANAVCNWNANVSIKSQNGGLLAQGVSAVTGFKNRLDYQLQADFCGESTAFTTTGLANVKATTQCAGSTVNNRGLAIKMSTTSGSTPFLKATYLDVITLQIGVPL